MQEFNGDLLPQFMVDQDVIPVGENKDGDMHFIFPGSILAQDGILRLMRRPQDARDTALNMLYPWHQFSYDWWKNVDTSRKQQLVNYEGETAPWLWWRVDKRLEHALRKTLRVANWIERLNPAIVPKMEEGNLKFKNLFGTAKFQKATRAKDGTIIKPSSVDYESQPMPWIPWSTDSPLGKRYDKEGWLRDIQVVNHVTGLPLQVYQLDPQRAEARKYYQSRSNLAQLTKGGYSESGWLANVTGDVGKYDNTFKGTKEEYKVRQQYGLTLDTLNFLKKYKLPGAQGKKGYMVENYTGEYRFKRTYQPEGALQQEDLKYELLKKPIKHPYEKGKTVTGGIGYLEAKKTVLQTQLEELSNAQNVTSK